MDKPQALSMNAVFDFLKYGTFLTIIVQQIANIEFVTKLNIFSDQYVIPVEYNQIVEDLLS